MTRQADIVTLYLALSQQYPVTRGAGCVGVGRWIHRQWGDLQSHLSSLKATLHHGNRRINIDSAANLCIHQLRYISSFVCTCSPMTYTHTHCISSPCQHIVQYSNHAGLYLKWFYLNINMYTKLQATIAYF